MSTRIVTCCYCGSRAALVLDGGRHHLACGSCGAPVSQITDMSQSKRSGTAPVSSEPAPKKAGPKKKKKSKKKKSRLNRIFDEVFDEIEDFFD